MKIKNTHCHVNPPVIPSRRRSLRLRCLEGVPEDPEWSWDLGGVSLPPVPPANNSILPSPKQLRICRENRIKAQATFPFIFFLLPLLSATFPSVLREITKTLQVFFRYQYYSFSLDIKNRQLENFVFPILRTARGKV